MFLTLLLFGLLGVLVLLATRTLINMRALSSEVSFMSAELDALKAQIQANSDTIASAVTLINGIADRITAAGTDPAALAALTADLKASDQALASAVAANTPAAPPTP